MSEEQSSKEQVLVKTLLFAMERILGDTQKDEIMISATRFGRTIEGLRNGSRETLSPGSIRNYTYYLELIRRNWPQLASQWTCQEVATGNYMCLEFKRKARQ